MNNELLTGIVSNYHHLTRKEMAAQIGKSVRTVGRAIEKLGIYWQPHALIGALKIMYIGYWMLPLMKTAVELEKGMPNKILQQCVVLPLICSIRIRQRKTA